MLLNIYNYFRREMNSGTILGYFLQALPIACIVGIAFFAIRFTVFDKGIIIKHNKNRANLH